MNLINSRWLKRGLSIEKKDGKLIITNNSNSHIVIPCMKIFKAKQAQNVSIKFFGENQNGNACVLKMINRYRSILETFSLNSTSEINLNNYKYYFYVLYIPSNSRNVISKIEIENLKNEKINFDDFKGDILVVTPGYPSIDNKYNSAFVHTRVKAYLKMNWKVDVLYINEFKSTHIYEFDGVKIVRSNFSFLRELLQNRKYSKILIHFFDQRYANVLESIDLSDTFVYFYLHGAETLYRDWPKIASPYFGGPAKITNELESLFKIKDYYIRKYNNMKNAKWIFVTPWTKKRCEELLDIKFNNYDIIPCLVDTEIFSYTKKNPELRKKIFVIRKFDDINSYSLDTVARIILELSRRTFFNDLQFDIYGDGALHETIIEPLKKFENVHIFKKFLTHKEIKKVHDEHGIALFPTRFDSQAVSSCEAASSGCAVITSNIPGPSQFFPKNLGILCDSENYKEYADVIEKMYYDEEYFLKVALKESQEIQSKFDYDHTIQKEIDMFEKDKFILKYPILNIQKPILSIIIPSYNVEKYLRHTVYSIIDQINANKIEILIVNDGSIDNTKAIAKELSKKYGSYIVRLIDKENGGHGSTINVGIEQAKGKYFKIIDGDDTVDSEEFAELINILEKEESDIVLNNYIEDYSKTNNTNIMKIYNMLKPGIQYHFDDLCHDNYGFSIWGPILSCSSYKTEVFKNKFKISEKMFYVDMELNTYIAIYCDTITYYDLNIYRYLLGREGQSVSKESYIRNYKNHENVCINMIEIYYKNKYLISEEKRHYIINKLIIPIISTQYEICLNYFKVRKAFLEFDKRLKSYPEFYYNKRILIKKVRFYRKTKGRLKRVSNILVTINGLIK